MTRQIELSGASGARYRYTALDEERFLPPAGANYVIAKVSRSGVAEVFYAGETDNLSNRAWRTLLDRAKESYGATAVLTRLNVTRAIREAERADLIEQYHPPMNQ